MDNEDAKTDRVIALRTHVRKAGSVTSPVYDVPKQLSEAPARHLEGEGVERSLVWGRAGALAALATALLLPPLRRSVLPVVPPHPTATGAALRRFLPRPPAAIHDTYAGSEPQSGSFRSWATQYNAHQVAMLQKTQVSL